MNDIYQTKQLVDADFDFAGIFPEKQTYVKDTENFEFELPEVVAFLQQQTDNFKIENPVALDVDRAIVHVVTRWAEQEGVPNPFLPEDIQIAEETPVEVVEVEGDIPEAQQNWIDAIYTYEEMVAEEDAIDTYGEENVDNWSNMIETYIDLLQDEGIERELDENGKPVGEFKKMMRKGGSTYAGGGKVKYYLNGFEENLNYILDSTDAVEVNREGSLEEGNLVVYFETKNGSTYAGGGSTDDGFKRFDVDFYDSPSARETSYETIIRGDDFEKVIKEATKIAKEKDAQHVEFNHRQYFIGSIDKKNDYAFKNGSDWDKNPLGGNYQKDYTYADGGEVTYELDKDGKGWNVYAVHPTGEKWKVGEPMSKEDAQTLLNKVSKRMADGGSVNKERYIVYGRKEGADKATVFAYKKSPRAANMLLNKMEREGDLDDYNSWGYKDTEDYFYSGVFNDGGELDSYKRQVYKSMINDWNLEPKQAISLVGDNQGMIMADVKSDKSPKESAYLILEKNGVMITMTSEESERLDYLQSREDTSSLTKDENTEYESLVEKYRLTKDYKGRSKKADGGAVFEEGDEYWAVSDGNLISESVWDDESEEIANPYVFVDLPDALKLVKSNGFDEARVQYLSDPSKIKILQTYEDGGETDGDDDTFLSFHTNITECEKELTKLKKQGVNCEKRTLGRGHHEIHRID